jgi:D-alanyl-D-alanine dipeptidase
MDRCQAGGFELAAVGNVAQAHMHVDGRNVPIRLDEPVVPTITSAPAGGIRCSLDDMLAWARMWLGAEPAHAAWLSAERRREVWTPHMPLPVSDRQRAWDNTHFHAYGYGWRLSDVDGNFVVGHTGTLGGMYSALVLLPDRRSGFILMTNGPGDEARTVLTQVLLDQFTAPGQAGTVAHYAGLLAAERSRRGEQAAPVPASGPRAIAEPASLTDRLGIYRDPWFGEIAICTNEGRVRFEADKSPRLTGTLMRVGDRLLVDWDLASVDAEPWLDFQDGDPVTLALSHVDPDADFSYDYADLAFTRMRGCGQAPAAADGVAVSSAASAVEAGLVDIALLAPGIDLDIRYAGTDNFVGTVVDGYEAPRCWLLEAAAEALQEVSTQLRPQGLRLRVFDCYRPVRAVKHFVRWARDAGDLRTRPRYYPNLDKSALLGDYIAESSGHSRGATLDLTLLRCTDATAANGCEPLDMGTPFDFFDPRAHTDSSAVTPAQAANRALLRDAMARAGFANYPLEWWHYTWSGIQADAPAHDVVVR